MTLHDDLVAAKDLIDTPEKWRQDGTFGYGTGCLCIMGAVLTVLPYNFQEVKCALSAQMPSRRALVAFNDDPSTTHADVMALFDRAIAFALHSTEGERK